MSKISRLAGVLILSSALAGCGGFEYLALTGAVKGAQAVSIGFGRIISDAYARALGCAFASGFGVFSETLKIELETVEKNFIAEEIKAKNIVDPNRFYDQLDAAEGVRLKAVVRTAYDALDPKSTVRGRSIDFYLELLASGLMASVKENVQVRYVTVLRHFGDKDKPERFETFGLSIRFLHAGDAEPKTYAVCK